MVPEGWSIKELHEVAKVITGTTPPTNRPDYYGGGFPFVSPADLDGSKYVSISAKTLTQEGKKKARVVPAGSTLFTCIGSTIGKLGVAKVEVSTNQQINSVIPNDQIDPDFLFYQLQLRAPHISRIAGTQAVPLINKSDFERQVVAVPHLRDEQEKIGGLLSTWDNAISATERLLAASEKQKKALMQQLLTGKKRLPGFGGEWKSRQLGELFSRVTKRNTEGNTTVVTISAQQGLIRQEDFFSKSVASETLDGYFLLEHGQFAYNKSYSNGYPMGAIKRLHRYPKAVVTSLYICFDVKDPSTCSADFFEQWFEAGLLNRGLSKVANEGGRAHGLLNVKPSDFFGLEAFTPPIEEQHAIANVLAIANQDVELVREKLSRLKQEKKALMQQLLTGKRRVKTEDLAYV